METTQQIIKLVKRSNTKSVVESKCKSGWKKSVEISDTIVLRTFKSLQDAAMESANQVAIPNLGGSLGACWFANSLKAFSPQVFEMPVKQGYELGQFLESLYSAQKLLKTCF